MLPPEEKRKYLEIISGHENVIRTLMKNKDEPWYIKFDEHADIEGFFEEYKYDPRLKRFYQYEEGVFHEFCVEELETMFNEWGDKLLENMTTSKISLLKKRYIGKIIFKGTWDPDPNIDNCLNGLVYKEERELRPHTPKYPSRYQIQRNYSNDIMEGKKDPEAPKLFQKMVGIIEDEQERLDFQQFLINVVHQNYDDELFCMFYGPRNGGKSTLMRLFELLFGGEIISKTELQTIGTKFGYEDLYDKRVNVNPDLPTIDLTEMIISRIKLLTGNDGLLPVNVKGVRKFSYIILCFLVFGINQLMGFNVKSEKEMESIFRRVLLIAVPNKLPSDPEFKKATQDPKFLDELYSWLVYQRPRRIIENIDEWIFKQKGKWFENSDPVLTLLKELFIYEEGSFLPVHYVQEKVVEALTADDSIITSKSFKGNLTQALSTMKIYKDNKRGLNSQYINIAEVI